MLENKQQKQPPTCEEFPGQTEMVILTTSITVEKNKLTRFIEALEKLIYSALSVVEQKRQADGLTMSITVRYKDSVEWVVLHINAVSTVDKINLSKLQKPCAHLRCLYEDHL